MAPLAKSEVCNETSEVAVNRNFKVVLVQEEWRVPVVEKSRDFS